MMKTYFYLEKFIMNFDGSDNELISLHNTFDNLKDAIKEGIEVFNEAVEFEQEVLVYISINDKENTIIVPDIKDWVDEK